MREPEPGDSHPTPDLTEPPGGRQRLWLSDLAIRQPVFITMVVAAVMLVGGLLYTRMPLDLYPDVSVPLVVVRTLYPGAGPQEVERSVTEPVEEAMASINGVETVRSTTMDSLSLVIVEFAMSQDARDAAEQVRLRVNAIRASLPTDAQEPVIERFDPSAAPVLAIAVADPADQRPAEALRAFADQVLKPRLERAEGVAAVEVSGGRAHEVHVDLRRDQLDAHRVSPQQVIQAIRASNLELPAGRVPAEGVEQPLRVAGEVESIAQLGEVPVARLPQGGALRVKHLADLSLDYAETRTQSRLDGQESVVAQVRKQSGTNTVQVAEAARAELRQLEQEFPGLSFAIAFDQSTFIQASVQDLQLSLLLGALLAALVVLVFFRDLRNTLVTVAGLPVIVLGTFAVLHVLGITLNMVSLMALSLSVGLLIDDAIVVRENVFRHTEAGEEPAVAAQRGTAEIALPVLAITSTIVAVFLPTAYTGGLAGKFLRDFGVTIAVAVLISLVEAFTLAPMLSARMFRRQAPRGDGQTHRARRRLPDLPAGYRGLLEWSLSHRPAVVGLALLLLAGSLGLIPYMVFSFAPETDQGQFGISLQARAGAGVGEADRLARAAEAVLRAAPETAHVFTTVGSDAGGDTASVRVQLSRRGHTPEVVARLRPALDQALDGAKYSLDMQSTQNMSGSTTVGAINGRPIQFAVQGDDFQALDRASAALADRLRRVPGVVDVDRTLADGKPSQTIVVNRERAAELGITPAQVGATVRALLNGEQAGSYRAGGEARDILVRLAAADRGTTADVLRLPMVTPRGDQVPLSEVAQLVPSTEPPQISRENRRRHVVVGAGTAGSDVGTALADARAAVADLELPDGVVVRATGQARYMDEMFISLGIALALAVFFVYMILASQFGSFVHPFTIMLALPFAAVGALLALFLAGLSFDMLGMLGIILLVGLVAKNSILLVEFANQGLRRGLPAREAILEAGAVRLRPILMTTLALIFGMLPLALGIGAGSEMRRPMGVSVIGGLLLSTLLTLLVIPVAYSLIDDLTRWITGRRCAPATNTADRQPPQAGGGQRKRAALWGGLTVGLALVVSATVAGSGAWDKMVARPTPAASATDMERPLAQRAPAEPARPVAAPTPLERIAVEVIPPQPAPAAPDLAGVMPRPPAGQPAPAAQGTPRIGNTGGRGANLRAAPGTSAQILAAFPEGTALQAIDQATDAGGRAWVKVRDPRGTVGWVAQDYLLGPGGATT